MKTFYEDKIQIKWTIGMLALFFIVIICSLVQDPSEWGIWICFAFYLYLLIASIKHLKEKGPYMIITSEFLKIKTTSIPWNKIKSITLFPIRRGFTTNWLIETQKKRYGFPFGTFSNKIQQEIFQEIEKYKSIKFDHCTKKFYNSNNSKRACITILILLLLVITIPFIIQFILYLIAS